jgi:predicted nucleotidyltransferase
MGARVAIPTDVIADFCRRHHIRKLALFGSVLREDFRPDSDIDVLVEFEPGQRVGLIRLAGIERELTELLGRRVDLRKPGDLSPYFREEVLDSAEVIYAG